MRTVDWRTIWEDKAEPGQLRRVLSGLSNSMGGSGGQPPTNCSPSMPRIARRAGMRRDSASKWIRIAEEEGWINVGRKRGLRSRYYATVPPEWKHLLTGDEPPPVEAPDPIAKLLPVEGAEDEAGCPECQSVQDVEQWTERGHCVNCGWVMPTAGS